MNGDDHQTPPEVSVGWQFKPGDVATPDSTPQTTNVASTNTQSAPTVPSPAMPDQEIPVPADESVTWTASEFIAHEKGAEWYLTLILVTAVVTAIIYLLTRDKVSSAVVVLAAILFGVYGARKPRTLEYRLSNSGLTIAEKFYEYDQFRSFAIIKEVCFPSLNFMPLKRFMPILTVYYSPEDEQKIVGLLQDRLPLENHGRDSLERFLQHIRF